MTHFHAATLSHESWGDQAEFPDAEGWLDACLSDGWLIEHAVAEM